MVLSKTFVYPFSWASYISVTPLSRFVEDVYMYMCACLCSGIGTFLFYDINTLFLWVFNSSLKTQKKKITCEDLSPLLFCSTTYYPVFLLNVLVRSYRLKINYLRDPSLMMSFLYVLIKFVLKTLILHAQRPNFRSDLWVVYLLFPECVSVYVIAHTRVCMYICM